MNPELITAIIGVGGLAALLPKLVEGWVAWRSGKAVAERGRNRTALQRLAAAEVRAEAEADFRRALEEYAGALRLLLVSAGVPAERIPAWPVRRNAEK
jgi:hypothetical protein